MVLLITIFPFFVLLAVLNYSNFLKAYQIGGGYVLSVLDGIDFAIFIYLWYTILKGDSLSTIFIDAVIYITYIFYLVKGGTPKDNG